MTKPLAILLALGGLATIVGLALLVKTGRATEPLGHATGEGDDTAAVPPLPAQGQAEPGTFLSLAELRKSAELAVHGKVRSVGGRLIDGVPFQEAIVAVERVLQPKGLELSELSVLVYGGEAEGLRSSLNGAPTFAPGQEVVLFLRKWNTGYVILGIQ